jgi:LmbE family N-acetylglucosaminyl deacetylase
MVNPLCDERKWLDVWAELSAWEPPPIPMLVVSPHPDDETLAVGGLIAAAHSRGIDVTLLAVTDGESAYGLDHSLGVVRQTEQERAAAHLGIPREKIVRLCLPDSGVMAREAELIRRMEALVSRNTFLVAPWSEDFHPDHKACGRAAERVAAAAGIDLASYFFWTWHTQRVDEVETIPLRKLELNSEWLAAKTMALAEHRSQLTRNGGTPILTEDLLWPARQACEVFLLS